MVQGYASVSPYALLLCVSAGLCDNMLYPPDLEKGRDAARIEEVTLGYSYLTNLVTSARRERGMIRTACSRTSRVPH
jgi:hypothetical protein